jgi:hypothetical protein
MPRPSILFQLSLEPLLKPGLGNFPASELGKGGESYDDIFVVLGDQTLNISGLESFLRQCQRRLCGLPCDGDRHLAGQKFANHQLFLFTYRLTNMAMQEQV